MSLSISKCLSHAGFIKTTIYNSKEKYIRSKKIDLRIYSRKVIALKISYFWNDSKPKYLTPKSISFDDQIYYFSTIRLPDKTGENSLTVNVEVWNDGKFESNPCDFTINIER